MWSSYTYRMGGHILNAVWVVSSVTKSIGNPYPNEGRNAKIDIFLDVGFIYYLSGYYSVLFLRCF